jgi:heme-degrading monooxygenase HmoA
MSSFPRHALWETAGSITHWRNGDPPRASGRGGSRRELRLAARELERYDARPPRPDHEGVLAEVLLRVPG